MKLLFITQKIDANNTVLGFVHGWLAEFAKRFSHISVICLEKGEYHLPANVSVFSLGKEGGRSQVKYLKNFVRYIVQNRREYDVVLVHMNQEYILLGGLIWKILGKPIFMWRNHYAGSWLTRIAVAFCTEVFCTSKFSYTAKFRKTVVMPVGVDITLFRPVANVSRIPNSILFYARISPAKRPNILLEALALLSSDNVQFSASFYGSPLPQDTGFFEQLKKKVQDKGLAQKVRFVAGVPHAEGPRVFSAHEIFVNLSPSGMYDKTLFEAAGGECLVVASSLDFKQLAGERFSFPQDDSEELAGKLKHLLSLSNAAKQELGRELRILAVEQHSLEMLGKRLYKELTK